ncbi:MAG: GNAT family N-acetyltransferase [Candidatus Thorarchaeota archaeon]
MKTSIVKWNELDIDEVGQLIFDALQSSGDYRKESRTVSQIVDHIKGIRRDSPWYAVLTRDGDSLAGFIALKSVGKTSVELNPHLIGHPTVSSEVDRKRVAKLLLETAASWAKERGLESLVLGIELSSYDGDKRYGFSQEWYLENGFNEREADIYMMFDLSEYEEEAIQLPDEYTTILLREADKEDLYSCFYETFKHGQSSFFFDQSEKERREYFEATTSTEALDEESTITVMKDGHTVGFSFARPYGTPGNYLVEWIGVHPEHRKKGLGQYIMKHIANVAKQKGFSTMSLSCAKGNTRGYALYSNLGWYDDGGETILACKIS